MPEILKNIKAEDRLKKIRIVSENDDVMGGQPEADGMKENDNNAIFDLACSVMHALAEVAKVDQKAIPQILDALGDSRTAGASQRIVNEVNKLAKAAQTAANQANDKANSAISIAEKATPIGTMSHWPGDTAPDGWLFCRGQSYSSSTYPALYSVLKKTTLPDARGVMLRGLDAGRGFDPGRTLLSYQEDTLQDHTHVIVADGSYYAIQTVVGNEKLALAKVDGSTLGAKNGRIGHETVSKNIALNIIIKVK